MGIKPEVIVAPSALAELAQKAATIQKAFALSPAMQTFVIQTQDFQNKLKDAYDKSGIAKLAKQIKNTFAKVKTWVKKLFVKYLPIALPLFEIPRAHIQPSSGKVLQLPNSYRSHSPPLCSVIK
jgi:hypothetical protein